MSNDAVEFVAKIILSMDQETLQRLRLRLQDETGGDETGVGAVIPPNLPLREGAAEVELPEDYWETAQ